MENLWKKESENVYVDLFDGKSCAELENVISWKSLKDNQHSTDLRMKGNVKVRSGDLVGAMNCYTQSLCFAEIGSENVALSYAKRSECFFHMQMFNESLIDIELALASNPPGYLKCEQRKLQIISALDANSVVNYVNNSNLSCFPNAVKIKRCEQFGRHLIAKCDIPVGQTVLIEEDFIAIRTSDVPACFNCFRERANFVACSLCPDVVFCSNDCMSRSSTHKWECGTFFSQLHFKTKFQMKAVLQAIDTFNTVDRLVEFVENVLDESPDQLPKSLPDFTSKYHFFLKLEKSTTFHAKLLVEVCKIFDNLLLLPKIATIFHSIEKQRFLMHLVGHHFLVIKNNCILSREPWSMMSVFNVLSMLNHSCAPNLYHPRKGKRQYCVTIRPVEKGQQLFISYLSINDQSFAEQRQAKLKSTWGFNCMCDNCHMIDKPLMTLDHYYEHIVANYRDIESECSNNAANDKHCQETLNFHSENQSILMDKCITFLNKYGHLQMSAEIQRVTVIFINLYIDKHLSG